MRPVLPLVALLAALSPLSAGQADAGDASYDPGAGWQLERDVDTPTYAFIEPTITDLDIDVIVLSCEPIGQRVGLQLRLYPLEPGPLRSSHSTSVALDPEVAIEIDGRRHNARLLFADDFVIVADAADGAVPILSSSLVASLQAGRDLTMKLHSIEASPASVPVPTLQITADLQAGIGGTAITTLRRCAAPNDSLTAGSSREP
jgi:hypothetical protein